MKVKIIVASVLSGLMSLIPLDTLAQGDLNIALQEAICEQNWNQAISIINEMKRLAPAQAQFLTVYQTRLQTLASQNIFIPSWVCSGSNLPDVAQVAPTPIPTQQEGTVYTIPIKGRSANSPVVEVTFNDSKTYDMIFDTGATVTKILPTMAQSLQVESTTKSQVTVADGRSIEVEIGIVKSLTVGDLTMENVSVTFAQSTNEKAMDGMGLLGQNVFGDYDITIKEEVIELREREAKATP